MIVYTAITNNYDTLKFPDTTGNFIAFVNPGPFGTETPCTLFDDPCLNAKIHKILPHRFFPYAEYSLWVDGSIEILPDAKDLQKLIDTYLSDSDICVFKHPHRDCAYSEAMLCKDIGVAGKKVDKQIDYYYEEAFPEEYGCWEVGAMLRRHSASVNIFNEMWWDQILRFSKRDQISFPYVKWATDMDVATFPGSLSTNQNTLFKVHGHTR